MDREDLVGEPGLLDSPQIVSGRDPQVRRPDLDAVLSGEEDAGERLSASEIEDAQAGTQVHVLTEPLGQPEGV